MTDDNDNNNNNTSVNDDDSNDNKQPSPTASRSSASLFPHQTDETLLEPFRYINSVPGKDVRGTLIDCFQLWLQVGCTVSNENDNDNNNETILDSIKDIVGNLHNASLLIDDIEDNSQLRRGIPVAHKIFGIPAVINCANYSYFIAMEKCFALGNQQAMSVFLGELLNLHRGQGLDIAWREAVQCPTEQEYIAMVIDKTGGLFRLAVGLLQAFAPPNSKHKDTNFTPLVNNLATYFQIRDDYINLADEEYMKSKSFCEDLTEGKFSFPIIHCIRSNNPNDTRLLSILKQRTDDVDVKRYAQKLMKDSGSLSYTRQKCKQLKQQIVTDIMAIDNESQEGNPPLLKLIEKLDVQIEKMDDITAVIETPSKVKRGLDIDEA